MSDRIDQPSAVTRDAVAAAYGAAAAAWAAGPDTVYGRLADAMLDRSPVDLTSTRVLDVGAGTGAATRAALRRGARVVVAADLSTGMLRVGSLGSALPVAADACALPFRAGSFDLLIAACCLGHLPDPAAGLREARRVGRAIAATAFLAGWAHPAKAAVDDAMREFGFRAPDWYRALKRGSEPVVDDPTKFGTLAIGAGWRRVEVSVLDVPTGLVEPAELVDWRWGMAHLAPFVTGLSPARRALARAAAERAVTGAGELIVPLVVLTGIC